MIRCLKVSLETPFSLKYMKKKKDSNIIRFRRPVHLNIGIVIFAIVLIYFAIYIIRFTFSDTVAGYEVTGGQIRECYTHTGLVIREEEVVYADDAGSLNYYKKEGDKAAYGDVVCSIDESGELAKKITEESEDISNLSTAQLQDIQDSISDYALTYTDQDFYRVYDFQAEMNASIQEELYLQALQNYADEMSDAVSKHTFTFSNSPKAGIVSLYTDGLEGLSVDTFTASDFDPVNYGKTDLKKNTSVVSGDPLYKLATNENWYVMVPLSAEEAASLADTTVISVTFNEDQKTSYASCEIITSEDQSFLKLKYNTSMVRYISDRYLDLTLNIHSESGLKIPNTAITEKSFYVVPRDYITQGGDSGDYGVLCLHADSTTPEFISTNLYSETKDSYYIDKNLFQPGDRILKPDSDEELKLKETGKLTGVYNINKGYVVFKVIDILAQNQEYTIIRSGTSYGISMYDHIVLAADEVNEGDII